MDGEELIPGATPERRAPLPSDPDEDLFEFPAPGSPAGGRAPEGMSVAREATLAIEASNEILVRSRGSAPAGAQGFDPDEDIFDFDELFTAAESSAGDEVIAYYAEPEASTAPQGAPESTFEPTRPIVRSTSTPARSPANAGAPAEASGGASGIPPGRPVAPIAAGTAASSVESRLVLTLALGFILVNAALILTAWQASESFQSTLDYVRTDLSSALTDLRVQSELHAAAPVPAPDPAPDSEPQAPAPLASFPTLELDLAREETAAGAYSAARMRLYRLLANADRLVLDAADVAEAEYLIAETYFAQGESLPEERP